MNGDVEIITNKEPDKLLCLSESKAEAFAKKGCIHIKDNIQGYVFGRLFYVDKNQKEPITFKSIKNPPPVNIKFIQKLQTAQN